MRILWVFILLIGSHSTASACSCVPPPSALFLNSIRHGDAAIVHLPENAKGVLFFSDIRAQEVRFFDEDARLVERIPPAITGRQFVILEKETGRSIPAIVTRLNVDRQIYGENDSRFFRGKRDATAASGLKEVAPEVRKTYGLFRVGPAGGFRIERTYQITYRPTVSLPHPLQVEVTVGPTVALSSRDQYGLQLEGPPENTLLMLPEGGRCGAKQSAAVQTLSYLVPASLDPYRASVLFFTEQKVSSSEDGKVDIFSATNYRSSLCSRTQPGPGELGPLKDIVAARCPMNGPRQERQVKGFVGMLELEDTLHETPTYRIPFDELSGTPCAVAPETKRRPPLLLLH